MGTVPGFLLEATHSPEKQRETDHCGGVQGCQSLLSYLVFKMGIEITKSSDPGGILEIIMQRRIGPGPESMFGACQPLLLLLLLKHCPRRGPAEA